MQKLTLTSFIAAALGTGACAEMFPEKVATGIARLTVRNTAIVVRLTGRDTRCGFESPGVLAAPTVVGEPGEIGTVTWRVDNCTIDMGTGDEVYTDCNGTVITASGSFTINATKTIEGLITGDPASPAIPMSDQSATVVVEQATFNNFRVETSISPNAMTIASGTMSTKFMPRLARAIDPSVCSVATPIFTVTDLRLQDAAVAVSSPSLSFSAAVTDTNIKALNGRSGLRENHLEGTVTIFGGDRTVPNDTSGLDPDYSPDVFTGSFACDEAMEYPASFSCDLDQVLGENAARLSVKMLATLISAANANTECGFMSPGALAGTTSTGQLGRPGGTGTQTITGCVLDFTEPTVISTDCHGTQTLLQGQAVVSGTKSVKGFLTGDLEQPVVPTSWDPAALTITADVSQLKVSDTKGTTALLAKSGVLSGTLAPRMAIDTTTQACCIATPVAKIQNVSWNDGQLTIVSGAKQLGLTMDAADLEAVNGQLGHTANSLSGTAVVNGSSLTIPAMALDPQYDPDYFDQSYQCQENLEMPANSADCDMMPVLAQGAARLVTKSFGMLVKGIDKNDSCGFGSIDGVVPQAVGTSPGDEVTAVWDVLSCVLGESGPVVMGTDCNGKTTELHGEATVTATKSARGLLAASYPPIHPTVRDGARFDMHHVVVEEFHVLEYLAGQSEPQPYMIIHSGTFTGVGRPVTGEAASDPGAYYVALPISGFEKIRLSNADVSLFSDGKWFRFTINQTDLNAFNGSFNGHTNELSGIIMIDGVQYSVPGPSEDPILDPAYNQTTFNASYECLDNLAGLVPW